MNTRQTTTIPGQPLAYYDPEVAQRVQGWLASGKPLVWIPILSQENFPDTCRPRFCSLPTAAGACAGRSTSPQTCCRCPKASPAG
jgi:hypothetical protein